MKRMQKIVALIIGLYVGFALCEEEKPLYWMDEIVITATRVPDRIKDVPWGTEIITRKDILTKGIWGIDEAMRDVVGLDIRNYGFGSATSSISLRGSSSQQVLVLIDGIPINSVSLGMADLGYLNPQDIERIEVVKGPISSLYGANGLGGVVNLISRSIEKPHFSSLLSLGSFNTITSNLGGGYRFRDIGGGISLYRNSSSGMRTNSDFTAQGGRIRVSYRDFLKTSLRYYSRDLGLPGPKPGKSIPSYGDSSSSSKFDREVDSTLSLDISGKFSFLEIKFYIDNEIEHFITCYDFWGVGPVKQRDRYTTFTTGGSILLNLNPIQNHSLVLGIDGKGDEFSGKSEKEDTLTKNIIDTTQWSPKDTTFGVWIEEKWKPLEAISSILTLRYDRSSGYGDFLSPSLGLILAPNGFSRIKLSLGKAFRAPTFNDLYYPLSGNPSLKPEKGIAWETRLESSPLNNLFFNISLFGRRTDNLIAWCPDTLGFWHPENIDKSSILGSELKLETELANSLLLRLGGTFLSGKQTRWEALSKDYVTRDAAYIPKVSVSGNLIYSPIPNSEIDLEVIYKGERVNYYPDFIDGVMKPKKLSPYTLLNLRLSQKFLTHLKTFLNIENLLDIDYADQFGNSLDDRDYPRPGRSIIGGIGIGF